MISRIVIVAAMTVTKTRSSLSQVIRLTKIIVLVLGVLSTARYGTAQNIPLLSGGVGFFTATNGGETTYQPQIQPLIAAPITNHFLIESRGILLENWFPTPTGYDHNHLASFVYLQGDYLATPRVTVVGGSFLIPFDTYNDRLSEIWIENFQDAPLNAGIGALNTGTGVGGMLSGAAASSSKYTLSYNAWFSARSDNKQFNSERSSGGRASLYLKDSGLEVGVSYDRSLQGKQENFYGTHVWWEPPDTGLRLRSEYSHGQHAKAYWIEADYRTLRFGGPDSWLGRFEPVFRIQQTFSIDNLAGSDGVPSVGTQRADFGLDYNLPHNVRILTSYARQFSSTGDLNVWETGIVYRFLFPTWKGNAK